MRKKIFIIPACALLLLSLAACGGSHTESTESAETSTAEIVTTEAETTEIEETETEAPTPEITETEVSTEVETTVEAATESNSDTIRPEIKEAIDSYAAFIDEYCDFMKSYDSTNLTMLTEYAELMAKDAEMAQKFDAIADEDLNDAELKYYTDVQLKCSEKMLETSAQMAY